MDLLFRGTVPPDRAAELASWVERQTTTERVVRAVLSAGLEIGEIVHMDEFTLDLIVPLPDGLVLVYDTT